MILTSEIEFDAFKSFCKVAAVGSTVSMSSVLMGSGLILLSSMLSADIGCRKLVHVHKDRHEDAAIVGQYKKGLQDPNPMILLLENSNYSSTMCGFDAPMTTAIITIGPPSNFHQMAMRFCRRGNPNIGKMIPFIVLSHQEQQTQQTDSTH